MNAQELIEQLKAVRSELPPMAVMLYVELLMMWMDGNDTVTVGNGTLMELLDVSDRTLCKYRDYLVSRGLIEYVSGGKKQHMKSSYKFIIQGRKVGAKGRPKVELHVSPLKVNTVLSLEPIDVGGIQGRKAGAKRYKDFDTEIWGKCCDVWFNFYKSKCNGISPTFGQKEVKLLKVIIERLQALTIEKGYKWDVDTATRILGRLFQVAGEDKWISENLGLSTINAKYDNIINNAINGKQQSNSKSHPMADMHAKLSRLNGGNIETI
jgi:hypothetical protein